MKKIFLFLFLNLILTSCTRYSAYIESDRINFEDCCCHCQCVDWSQFDYEVYQPEPDEELKFIVLSYEKYFFDRESGARIKWDEIFFEEKEALSRFNWTKHFKRKEIKYCYEPKKDHSLQSKLKIKNKSLSKSYFSISFLNFPLAFPFISSFLALPHAIACRPKPSYKWVYYEEQSFKPDQGEKYFLLFKIYSKSNQELFEAKYSPSSSRLIYFPYFPKAHSIKVFLMSHSTKKQIQQVEEIFVPSLKEIKNFDNHGTKNCYVKREFGI